MKCREKCICKTYKQSFNAEEDEYNVRHFCWHPNEDTRSSLFLHWSVLHFPTNSELRQSFVCEYFWVDSKRIMNTSQHLYRHFVISQHCGMMCTGMHATGKYYCGFLSMTSYSSLFFRHKEERRQKVILQNLKNSYLFL